MALKGRPRKFVAREPNGRADRKQHKPSTIGETEEMSRMKAVLFGPEPLDDKGNKLPHDKQLTTDSPLDIMHARGLITEEQRRAGYRFAELRQQLFGPPSPRGGSYGDTLGGKGLPPIPPSVQQQEETEEKRRGRYELVIGALEEHGRRIRAAVENAVIYLRLPRATVAGILTRDSDRRELEEVQQGLAILAQWYGYEVKKAA